jgi:hypothetical protein
LPFPTKEGELMHRYLWPVAVLVAAAVLVGAAAGDSVTVGQTPTPTQNFVENIIELQAAVSSGTSYTVPPGDWQVTSWRVNIGTISNAGPMAAVLAQPTGGGNYTIDAVSPVEMPAANTLNVFPASFAAHGGDVLGFWIGSLDAQDAAITGDAGDVRSASFGHSSVPSVGDSITSVTFTGARLPVSLTLTTTPEQKIGDLRDLVASMGIQHGITNALESKLQNALDALAADDTAGACDWMQSFLNLVNAQTGKKITPAQAQQLTDAANDIRTQLGC